MNELELVFLEDFWSALHPIVSEDRADHDLLTGLCFL